MRNVFESNLIENIPKDIKKPKQNVLLTPPLILDAKGQCKGWTQPEVTSMAEQALDSLVISYVKDGMDGSLCDKFKNKIHLNKAFENYKGYDELRFTHDDIDGWTLRSLGCMGHTTKKKPSYVATAGHYQLQLP